METTDPEEKLVENPSNNKSDDDNSYVYPEEVLADDKELPNPEAYVDPADSSRVDPDEHVASEKLKEHVDHEEPNKRKEIMSGNDKETHENLKSTLLISGAVVAVIGAIVAIVKKMREA